VRSGVQSLSHDYSMFVICKSLTWEKVGLQLLTEFYHGVSGAKCGYTTRCTALAQLTPSLNSIALSPLTIIMPQPMFEKQGSLAFKEGTYEPEIPAPATAYRFERRGRLMKGILRVAALIGVTYLAWPYLSATTEDHRHYGLVKPRLPMKPSEARKLFL
jgi:hypothetical protein